MFFGSQNDRDIIKQNQIDTIVRQLAVSYAQIRRLFQAAIPQMGQRIKSGDVTGVVRLARNAYTLPNHLVKRVGYSAAIADPAVTSLTFGVTDKLLQATLMFKDSEKQLSLLPEYRILHYIAHEMSHVRMYHDRHELRNSEFATDVLALMVAGSRVAYERDMISREWQYGYIRGELLPEVFRCLDRYTEIIYSK